MAADPVTEYTIYCKHCEIRIVL